MRSDPRHRAEPDEPRFPSSTFERFGAAPSKRNLLVLIAVLGVAALSPVLFDVFLGTAASPPS
jgi:hypothetical protein